MNYSNKRCGLIFTLLALFITLAFTLGCSKSADKVGVQPSDMSPNVNAQPETPNASVVKSDMTKEQQSKEMPLPGQANDHSTLDPNATQKKSKP